LVQLDDIVVKIRDRRYEFSKHAVDQSIVRGITVSEMDDAVLHRSEVIEDYPDDERGPSCLLLGFTLSGRPLHVHVSYPSRPVLKIITLYEPDPELWVDFRRRKGIIEAER
jgi:hypothetical protein